jgi:hypothetical protein
MALLNTAVRESGQASKAEKKEGFGLIGSRILVRIQGSAENAKQYSFPSENGSESGQGKRPSKLTGLIKTCDNSRLRSSQRSRQKQSKVLRLPTRFVNNIQPISVGV